MRRNETTSLPIGIAGMPITLDEAKTHERIQITKDDTILELYIEAATTSIEDYVNKRYTDRSFELVFDCKDEPFTKGIIELERFNDVISVISIDSFDKSNVSTPVPAAAFTLIGRRIQLEDTFSDIEFRDLDSLVLEYSVTGIAAPETINQAIKELVAHFYESRTPIVIGTIVGQIPYSIEALLQGERIWNV